LKKRVNLHRHGRQTKNRKWNTLVATGH
jgi:hypothetical protein